MSAAALQLGLFNRSALHEAQALHVEGVGFLTILVKRQTETVSHSFKATQLPDRIKYLDKKHDSYLSQGEFFRPNRRLVNLWRVPVCFMDLDIYNSRFADFSPDTIARDIRSYLEYKGVPVPSLIIHSGRGIYAKWLLSTPVPQSALPRWNAVQRSLVELLRDFGADPRARDASRILRLVHTVNTKQEDPKLRKVRVIDIEQAEGEPIRYDFEDLAAAVLPFTREELADLRMERATKREQQRSLRLASNNHAPHIYRGLNFRQLHWNRVMDFKRLIEIRGGYIAEGLREEMLFQMVNSSLWSGVIVAQDLYHELRAMGALISPNFKQGSDWKQSDFSTLHSKALAGAAYKFKNQTLMDRLRITSDEERQLGTIIGHDEKMRRRREKSGAEARRGERQGLVTSLSAEGMKQAEIAAKTGLAERTIRNYLNP